jgi:hypothetical protein
MEGDGVTDHVVQWQEDCFDQNSLSDSSESGNVDLRPFFTQGRSRGTVDEETGRTSSGEVPQSFGQLCHASKGQEAPLKHVAKSRRVDRSAAVTRNTVGMSRVDWRWAAKAGFWDQERQMWREEMGGQAEYFKQREERQRRRNARKARAKSKDDAAKFDSTDSRPVSNTTSPSFVAPAIGNVFSLGKSNTSPAVTHPSHVTLSPVFSGFKSPPQIPSVASPAELSRHFGGHQTSLQSNPFVAPFRSPSLSAAVVNLRQGRPQGPSGQANAPPIPLPVHPSSLHFSIPTMPAPFTQQSAQVPARDLKPAFLTHSVTFQESDEICLFESVGPVRFPGSFQVDAASVVTALKHIPSG